MFSLLSIQQMNWSYVHKRIDSVQRLDHDDFIDLNEVKENSYVVFALGMLW